MMTIMLRGDTEGPLYSLCEEERSSPWSGVGVVGTVGNGTKGTVMVLLALAP